MWQSAFSIVSVIALICIGVLTVFCHAVVYFQRTCKFIVAYFILRIFTRRLQSFFTAVSVILET